MGLNTLVTAWSFLALRCREVLFADVFFWADALPVDDLPADALVSAVAARGDTASARSRFGRRGIGAETFRRAVLSALGFVAPVEFLPVVRRAFVVDTVATASFNLRLAEVRGADVATEAAVECPEA